ncbi:MAG: carotenoid biosynthesis protein [Rhodothermaceae bacterium]|nr:carotenoid biosynthesis protein [Rhodothermaceae bacterium]
MKPLTLERTAPSTRTSRWSLFVLLVFTLLSGIGYATFGRHPEWLQYIPSAILPELSQFFGIAFTFFAQGHIWISGGVLILYLSQRTGSKWLPGLVAVYVLSLSSELAGTQFGIPFGEYSYTELLGTKWFNLVPILIPLSWFTMAIPSFALAYYTFSQKGEWLYRILFGSFLLTLWDLSLDPAMSYLTTYWTWGETGPYYGMPWINLGGWYFTGIVLMAALHLLKADRWTTKLSIRWISSYYGLVLLLPLFMSLAAGLWGAIAATLIAVIPCAWLIDQKDKNSNDDDFTAFGNLHKINEQESEAPDELKTEALKDFFTSHSRSFSFAARFFSPEQYQLVTRLYAFCRTTDDISDTVALRDGREKAEADLNDWEQRVYLSYQGIPSGIDWLDELMARSNQAGVPFDLIQDLLTGVRTDLREVEIATLDELDRYCYCVASVVGVWLCYLFGVRDREVLDRASAMGRAMQVTNILRDVGEDIRMDRLYLPTEFIEKYGISKHDIIAMESGAQPINDSYRTLIEDLMERAEADYQYAFRGLTAIPISFARAAAVASEVYKGIHNSLRQNNYDNFKKRAYTQWHQKIILTFRSLRKLKQMQNRPSVHRAKPVFFSNQQLSNSHNRQKPLIVSLITIMLCFQCILPASKGLAQVAPHITTSNTSLGDKAMDSLSPFVSQVRALYIAGVDEEDSLEAAIALIHESQVESPLLDAYFSALTVLKAKHAFWPAKKMRYLKRGLPTLDQLVLDYPDHVEIRYLRLLSCYYLPKFLGYSSNVETDIETLARLLPDAAGSLPPELYKDMVTFVRDAGGDIVENIQLPLQGSPISSNNVYK